jgi:hypothetical protein
VTAAFAPTDLGVAGILRRSIVATWLELPRSIAASLVLLGSAAPLVLAGMTAPWPAASLASLPLALALTGEARFCAAVWRGDKPPLRECLRVDPVLALVLWIVANLGVVLIAGPVPLSILGTLLVGALVVIAPFAVAYGAARNRAGLSALRGGVILIAYRPGTALSLVGVSTIALFGVAASVGSLVVVVPVMLMVFHSGAVTELLRSIDEQPARQ